ncbi:hypothetical protein [Desulfonema magnum]|uniref:Uncharacterized protein n=1 Tax=Desulfonema magnum TaxID=45655 RepID=A0A975BK49_9BACT|nr:hypothetical protein [Desulfonema magnum]QTA86858.1 Uncharacterized protein dnm_028830 [Desulfonema magnum]
MHKHDEISSTERLLDLIRGHSGENSGLETQKPAMENPVSDSRSPVSGFRDSLRKVLSFGRKQVTIGVGIRPDELRLIKIRHASDQKQELLDYLTIPFKSDPNHLKAVIKRFCDSPKKNPDIWSSVSTSGFQIRHIKIPKVSKKEIANAVYWTYKKQNAFDEKEKIFDFEVLGNTVENGIEKIQVIAYTVPRQHVEELKSLFLKSGFPLTGISVHPFFLQNLFKVRWIKTDNKNVCILHIGMNRSRIDIFLSDGNLVLSRSFKAGMNSMVEAIKQKMNKGHSQSSAMLSDTEDSSMTQHIKTPLDARSLPKARIETEQTREIFFRFIHVSSDMSTLPKFSNPLTGTWTDIPEEDIFEMIKAPLKRVARQAEITINYYRSNFNNQDVGKIYISGQISMRQRCVDYICDYLDIPGEPADPFAVQESSVPDLIRVTAEKTLPESPSERSAFAPATGMALSRNSFTPNFIFTYKEKEKFAKIRRINHAIYACLFFIMLLCIGTYYWQDMLAVSKTSRLTRLKLQMETYRPFMDKNLILKKAIQIKRTRQTLKAYSKKYMMMAIISELSKLTPSNIRLLNFTADIGRIAEPGKEGAERTAKEKPVVILNGVIMGDAGTFESSLANYLAGLKKSPIFDQPVIKNRSVGFIESQEVLQFTAHLKL